MMSSRKSKDSQSSTNSQPQRLTVQNLQEHVKSTQSPSKSISTTTGPDETIDVDVVAADIFSWKLKKDSDGTVFAVYLIHVSVQTGFKWVLEKRYHQFRQFRNELKKITNQLNSVPFPKKQWFFNISDSVIQNRLKLLHDFLNATLTITPQPPILSEFLKVADNISDLTTRKLSNAALTRSISVNSLTASLSLHDFSLIKVLGQGSFGKVFLVRPALGRSNEVYAMKVLRKSDVVKRQQVEHTRAERFILAEISHPFVLKLKSAFQTEKKLFLITDFCPGGELFFHLKRMRRFPESMMQFYVMEISLALYHLHCHNIIYRDLKPENILLDREGHCKITDFGLSKILTPSTNLRLNTFCGTPEYLAPEMIMHRQGGFGYHVEIDWWALGIVCFECLTGYPPFYDKDFGRMCDKIINRPVRFSGRHPVGERAESLIKGLLLRDPRHRLGCVGEQGMQDLMSHEFFSDMDWVKVERKELHPPFVPPLSSSAEDTQNFDKEFTRLGVHSDSEAPEARPPPEDVFEGFSFTDDSEGKEPPLGVGGGGGGAEAGPEEGWEVGGGKTGEEEPPNFD